MANSSVKGAPSLTAVHQICARPPSTCRSTPLTRTPFEWFFFVDGAERSVLLDSAVHEQFQAGDEGRSALNEKQRGLHPSEMRPADADGRALYFRHEGTRFLQRENKRAITLILSPRSQVREAAMILCLQRATV